MKVALDAMGGDFAPQVPVEAAVLAVRELNSDLRILLVGREDELRVELAKHGDIPAGRIEVVHATDVISMSDKASQSLRDKPDSSLLRAIQLHKDGKADAVVSAGNTGAQMAASYMLLGLVEGVRRPTIAGKFPIGGGKFTVLLDVGANTDCKPIHLYQFAVMGAIFMEVETGKTNPTVGLISIGEEKSKGNELVLAAHYLLEQSELNFIGNVEGGDILSGRADVLVCDGFTGNIILKFAEAVGHILFSRMANGKSSGPLPAAIEQIRRDFDYAETGGVPLLGINGISLICHGRSDAKALKNAVREALTLERGKLQQAITDGMAKYDVGMFARGVARWKGFHERHDELEIGKDNE